METIVILTCAIFAFILLVFLSCGAIVFKIACCRNGKLVSKIISSGLDRIYSEHPEIADGQDMLKKREKLEINIQGHDGTPLTGYLISGSCHDRTIICVHGYHSGPMHDFGIATEELLQSGDLLLIDQRAHGKSGGKYITFGILESRDCKLWAQWLLKERGESHPVYLDGISMGATTVLLASGLELPQNVKGIIADCGFTSPKDILADVSTKIIKINPTILLISTDIFCRIFAGFSLNEMSTTRAMDKNRLPILFAHGTGDRLVPHHMTQEAFDACTAQKYLVLAKDAEHAMSYFTENERYITAIKNLFAECEKSA